MSIPNPEKNTVAKLHEKRREVSRSVERMVRKIVGTDFELEFIVDDAIDKALNSSAGKADLSNAMPKGRSLELRLEDLVDESISIAARNAIWMTINSHYEDKVLACVNRKMAKVGLYDRSDSENIVAHAITQVICTVTRNGGSRKKPIHDMDASDIFAMAITTAYNLLSKPKNFAVRETDLGIAVADLEAAKGHADAGILENLKIRSVQRTKIWFDVLRQIVRKCEAEAVGDEYWIGLRRRECWERKTFELSTHKQISAKMRRQYGFFNTKPGKTTEGIIGKDLNSFKELQCALIDKFDVRKTIFRTLWEVENGKNVIELCGNQTIRDNESVSTETDSYFEKSISKIENFLGTAGILNFLLFETIALCPSPERLYEFQQWEIEFQDSLSVEREITQDDVPLWFLDIHYHTRTRPRPCKFCNSTGQSA